MAGTQMVGASEATLRQARGNDISFIFQEPMTSLNPLHTIEKQLSESIELHQGLRGDKVQARILELSEQGRHSRPGKPVEKLSAPAVRWAATAGHDRHGPGQRARAVDRG